MKNRLLFSWAVFVLFSLFSKNTYAQCGNTAIEILNPNKIKTAIPVGGDLFWDREYPGLNFIVPYIPGEPETTTIYMSTLWLGGIDEEGELKTACQGSGHAFGRSEFWPGPIDNESGEVIENGCDNFDMVWKVSQEDILPFVADFDDNGSIDQAIPQRILRWPGRGNPHFSVVMGFNLPEQELAPFFDRNNNDIYEPSNGEYPIIDESWPDIIPNELTWCVYNDIQDTHTEVYGNPIGVEVHQLAYGFNCEDNDLFDHTIFTRHKIINKSSGTLSNFMAGQLMNMNLGCFIDNSFGCDTLLNTQYFYNVDNEDDHHLCDNFAEPPYEGNPPASAVTYLNRKMYKFIMIKAPHVAQVVTNTDPPANDNQHYYYLNGKWKDGTPMTFGDIGYNPSSNDFVDFLFFDNPNNPTGWSLNNLPFNLYNFSLSSQTLTSFGPFNLPNSESIEIDAAYSYHRHLDSTHLGNVNVALEDIPDIQSFYDNGFENGCTQIATSTDEFVLENIELEISPNPNNGHFSIFSENNFQNMSLTIFDINGKKSWRGNLPAGQNKIEVNMDENLRSGIYFLKVVQEDGSFFNQKIIVKK